jgi:PTS system N-acetylglucosamine-specific IIC component
VGLVYFGLYYGLFRGFIQGLDLKTPGREDDPVAATPAPAVGDRAEAFIAALGGRANLRAVSACTTRLRLTVASRDAVDEAGLKRLGARGVISPAPDALQVVLGPSADRVASDIRDALANAAPSAAPALPAEWLAVLGGAGNIETVRRQAGRLCVTLRSEAEDAALEGVGRGFARTGPLRLQILTG